MPKDFISIIINATTRMCLVCELLNETTYGNSRIMWVSVRYCRRCRFSLLFLPSQISFGTWNTQTDKTNRKFRFATNTLNKCLSFSSHWFCLPNIVIFYDYSEWTIESAAILTRKWKCLTRISTIRICCPWQPNISIVSLAVSKHSAHSSVADSMVSAFNIDVQNSYLPI